MKASRFIFSEISQKFPIMPFTARYVVPSQNTFLLVLSFAFSPTFIEHVEFLYDRALEEKRARLGLVECVNHELLQPYPVLHEKPGKKHISGFLSRSWSISHAGRWYWHFALFYSWFCRWLCCSHQIHSFANAKWVRSGHISSSAGAAAHKDNRWSWNQGLVSLGHKDKEERRWKEEER